MYPLNFEMKVYLFLFLNNVHVFVCSFMRVWFVHLIFFLFTGVIFIFNALVDFIELV
jgi:hypothetical protein